MIWHYLRPDGRAEDVARREAQRENRQHREELKRHYPTPREPARL